MKWYFGDTETASKWQQVTRNEWVIDSIDSFRMSDSFMNEVSDCLYEWFIDPLNQMKNLLKLIMSENIKKKYIKYPSLYNLNAINLK